MGPVSAKLQEERESPIEDILLLIVGSEFEDLKRKYMRLGIEEKEKFESVLGHIDTYDVLETSETANDFLGTLSQE